MRILWNSNHPDDASGYGRQTALWVPLLAAAGHEVAVSAFHGPEGEFAPWRGTPVLDSRDGARGAEMLAGHVAEWKPDVVITLMDAWALDPRAVAKLGCKVACWTPVDCTPLGVIDRAFFQETGAVPIAMSEHGRSMLSMAGIPDPLYVPHGIDLGVFVPPSNDVERDEARARFGVEPGTFVIGLNAANSAGASRKGFAEQFCAFARFHRKHPDSLLMVHTNSDHSDGEGGGLDLWPILRDLGIETAVAIRKHPVTDQQMALWYGALDVLTACSYAEGFGLPILEAQACGVPAVATAASAMTELAVRTVGYQPWWNPLHRAWWAVPRISDISRQYEVLAAGGRRLEAARRAAVVRAAEYEAGRVLAEHWLPALERLAE